MKLNHFQSPLFFFSRRKTPPTTTKRTPLNPAFNHQPHSPSLRTSAGPSSSCAYPLPLLSPLSNPASFPFSRRLSFAGEPPHQHRRTPSLLCCPLPSFPSSVLFLK
ncbi:hypothetical protein BVRB_8g188660 [Beta vulgaris subsp. vulgaris]|nr:hypothetical protein BVRB_8g188660 [Beta vulgaris subsp. vulgaris]